MDTLAPATRLRAYPPELVEHVLDDLAAHRRSLEEALEAALTRIDAAKAELAAANALRLRIGDLVLDAERRFARHDADTERAVGELLAATDAEVDAALAAARAEVARRKLVAAMREMSEDTAPEPDPTPEPVVQFEELQAVHVG